MQDRRSDKVVVPKTAELVADRIRGQIARGEFRPGDSLPPEAALMKRFGVARPSLREAIRILESDGLIYSRRGSPKGPEVRALDASVLARRVGLLLQTTGASYEDLYEAQFVIEPRAAALAATRRTEADLTALRELIDRARAAKDPIDFGPIAAEFHIALVRASKNATLTLVAEMLNTLALELYRARMVKLGPVREEVRAKSIAFYERVLAAVEAGDAEEVGKLWAEERMALSRTLTDRASEAGIVMYT